MRTYEFSVIASGLDPQAEDFESRFYDAGCDDALVSFQRGCIIVDFAREAETQQAAVESALEAVRRAGAKVERIEPDPLVNLSDIAARSGLTRAAVHNYSKGERRADFPAPIARVTTSAPLWDWAEVSGWLVQQGAIAADIWQQALFLKDTNIRIEQKAANDLPVAADEKQSA